MSNHTPWPWHLVVAEGCAPLVIKPGVHDICEMLGAASNAGVMADARLIAAAPELLVELRQLAETAHNHFTVPDSVWAAISKATGDAA